MLFVIFKEIQMKRLITAFLGASVTISSAHACDVCGCSASNQYLGLLPKANISFISLQYQYAHLESNHPSLFSNRPNEHGHDYYNTAQLWGRYAVNQHLQLFAFVPYRYNIQRTDSAVFKGSGIGDVSVLANTVLIRQDDASSRWQHQLFGGGGIKLPTGKYAGITAMDRLGLPNMQPGTGSWDFIVNANYTVKKASFGVNADGSYTITTPSSEHYKYGNKLNTGVLGFYSFELGKWSIVPQAGLRYEYSLHDYDNYERKWLNEQSGGYMSFATMGVQCYLKRAGARLTYQLPVSQNYSTGYVVAKQRIDAGIFFLL